MFKPGRQCLKICSGMLLIELMVSMVLALLLISFILEIYLASRKSQQFRAALNQVQNNANSAFSVLGTEIRRAGYIGCARLTKEFPVHAYGYYSLTPKNKLIVLDNNKFTVRYAGYPGVILKKIPEDDLTLYTSADIRFSSGDILIISDCKQAEIFQVDKTSLKNGLQKITVKYPLHYPFSPYAEISKLEINTYFIFKTNRKSRDGKPIFALYVADIKGRKMELVEGINSMKLKVDEGPSLRGVAMDLEIVVAPVKKNGYGYAAF